MKEIIFTAAVWFGIIICLYILLLIILPKMFREYTIRNYRKADKIDRSKIRGSN